MSERRNSALLSAFYGQPWAITPNKLLALQEILERHAAGEKLSEEEIALRIGTHASSTLTIGARAGNAQPRNGKVAIIPVTGVIAQHARMVNQVSTSSGSSCEAIGNMLDAAMADPDCSAIVFDVDSPGGSVFGIQELAGKIMSARGKKPMIAVANSQMASAAYWIGCAADELWVTPSGEVGSIGVFCVHMDASEAYAKEGLKPTIIKAGDHKAEGNPYEPLSKEALAYAQSQIDDYYAAFVKGAAQGRGVSVATVESDFGQGRTVTAQAAVRRGMADKVGTLDQALAKFGVSASSKRQPMNAGRAAESEGMDIAAGTGIVVGRPSVAGSADGGFVFVGDEGARLRDAIASALAADPKPESLTPEFVAADGALDLSPSAEDARNANNNRPHVAKEQTVPDSMAAPSGATAVDVNTAVVAERARAREIRALCEEHKVADANFAQALIDKGLSVPEASLEILKAKRAAQPAAVVTAMTEREAEKPFANLGEQLVSIISAARNPSAIDKRLLHIQAAASGMSEGVPSDGGFALQPEFSTEILQRSYQMGEVLSRVRRLGIGANSNSLKVNAIDETGRQTGSRFGGVQVFHANEADTATAKKPKFRQMELNLHKLLGIWYLTDELSQDTTALSAVAQQAFSEEITFTLENVIFNGNGTGQGLGFQNSGAVIVVAKEAAQATATLNVQNVTKMYSRMWGASRKNAVWFYDQSVEPQFFTMTLGAGTSQIPIYLPPGGLSASPYGTLMGRPMIPVEYAATLGTQGDLQFVDLQQYLYVDKGGPQQAQSLHVRFLNDELTFRITHRYDGQPIWNVPLTPANGGPTLSPFVTLAARP